jgi:phosphoenolpyruvate carboxylase
MPEWKIVIKGIATLQDRYNDAEITFEHMRDHVVKILRRKLAPYLREPKLDEDLVEILDEFAEVDNDEYYDLVKNGLYDWCDYNRVWIDPTE